MITVVTVLLAVTSVVTVAAQIPLAAARFLRACVPVVTAWQDLCDAFARQPSGHEPALSNEERVVHLALAHFRW